MPTTFPTSIRSENEILRARASDLNGVDFVHTIIGKGHDGMGLPLVRYLDSTDMADPPAPAWYIPKTNDIYIHVDHAKIGIPRPITAEQIRRHSFDPINQKAARTLGLLAHEAAHAAISHRLDKLEASHPHHAALLTLLEELRVENHAVRTAPATRPFLRASFGLILANLSDEFSDISHVVRAWTIARGRTLCGVAAPDETEAVDIAARTLLGDDVIDALTDILQEALTLPLGDRVTGARMIELCDEWTDLVGSPASPPCCTHIVVSGPPMPGEGPASPGDGDIVAEVEGTGPGKGDDASGEPGEDGQGDSGYGTPGADDPADDSDDHADNTKLTDEDGELMKMLKRDLTESMTKDWGRKEDAPVLSNSGEWAAKIFGNRRTSKRLDTRTPSTRMRQHVVAVAAELSNLSLPAITKAARHQQAPPGRMRSREALRASAEKAQGKMMTAKPWKATVRKHSSARPLVIGIATDTSGSMRWAEQGVAEFAYVYANAGHRIGARTAAVTFGDHVHRIARPGEVMDNVVTKAASDGTEEFDQAMAALDGVLHLTTPGSSARILFIISDGAFVKGGEPARAYEWVRRMQKAGTHIVWINDTKMDGHDHYTHWMRDAMKLPGFTTRAAGSAHGSSVFDRLNGAALEAIRKDISAA